MEFKDHFKYNKLIATYGHVYELLIKIVIIKLDLVEILILFAAKQVESLTAQQLRIESVLIYKIIIIDGHLHLWWTSFWNRFSTKHV